MTRCPECRIHIEGAWDRCPLCAAPVVADAPVGTGASAGAGAGAGAGADAGGGADAVTRAPDSPFPAVPLRFSRRRVLRALFLTSIAVIIASFLAQLLFSAELGRMGVLRSVWLGISAMWLVVLTAVRTRRNLAKSTVYFVVLVALVCVYWDYLTGWHGWSVTFAVPIVCASSILALLITVRLMRIAVGEHIVYSGLTVLLGLAPIGFLAFGWVTTPLPSAICGALSVVALVLLQLARGPDVRHELAKRLHL
ncbi:MULTISPECIES: DUF6320 domain-containing protein [unclassified Brachybacterium]|uniref:DUF6320 domain-containing protein n=1 Tax=unclassified Brachybacterium TaxID=2623841 RepID=UPI0036216081